MAEQLLENILKSLTYHQAVVLYWTCEGLSNENIAARYGYKKSWVVWQMSMVYHQLGIDRKDEKTQKKPHWTERRAYLKENVCKVFKNLINDDPENLELFPLVPPSVVEGIVVEEKGEIVPPPPPPSEPPPELPPPEIPPNPPPADSTPEPEPPSDFYPPELYRAWLMVLEDDRHPDMIPPPIIEDGGRSRFRDILLILGGAAGAVLLFLLFTRQPVPPPPVTDTVAFTQSIASSHTPESTLTAVPTQTLEPTATIEPSPTNAPATPTLLPDILFTDNFNEGMNEKWKQPVEGAPPIIVGEARSARFDVRTKYVFGDSTWTNYEVSLAMTDTFCQAQGFSETVTIGLRYQESGSMIAFRWLHWENDCQPTWLQGQEGRWTIRDQNMFPLPSANPWRMLAVSVQGDDFFTSHGGRITIPDVPSGGVALIIDGGVIIDNFVIRELP